MKESIRSETTLAHVDTPSEAPDSRTAPPVSGDISVKDIDQQIAALQEQRRQAARRSYPTFDDFARLPWRDVGAGVIRSASGACVVLIAHADYEADDWAKSDAARRRLSSMVTDGGVNQHDALVQQRDELLKVAHWALARLVSVSDLSDPDSEALHLQRALRAAIQLTEVTHGLIGLSPLAREARSVVIDADTASDGESK